MLIGSVLVLATACTRDRPAGSSKSEPNPAVRLALVTDLKGYLEPCGCTSRPLGGIDRMAATLRSLRDGSTPVLVLLAGDLFFDTAEIERVRVDQAHRNAETLATILSDIEVDAALTGAKDRAQRDAALERLRSVSDFPWLALQSDAEVVRLDAGGLQIAVVGIRPGADYDAAKAAIDSAEADTDLTIALVSGSRRDANRIAALDEVDFVVQGGLDEDEPISPRRAGSGWVLHAGRQGQGLTVVDVYRKGEEPFEDRSAWSKRERREQLDAQITRLAQKIEQWKAREVEAADLRLQTQRLEELEAERAGLEDAPSSFDGNAFSARWVELPKNAPTDDRVTKLMREHDKAVNLANKKAFADLKPPPLGPDDIGYVGSPTCGGCHTTEYAWWRIHPHGFAYLTLQKRNKEFNLDCVGCHVTGYEQPGGSTVTHNDKGALINVGCESCHGPGAAHVADPSIDMVLNPPESSCVGCHNEEHSDQFDYEAYRKSLIVPGHGLPTM